VEFGELVRLLEQNGFALIRVFNPI